MTYPSPQRSGKSDVMERLVTARVRAGHKILIVRLDGETAILPFKRPQDAATSSLASGRS